MSELAYEVHCTGPRRTAVSFKPSFHTSSGASEPLLARRLLAHSKILPWRFDQHDNLSVTYDALGSLWCDAVKGTNGAPWVRPDPYELVQAADYYITLLLDQAVELQRLLQAIQEATPAK